MSILNQLHRKLYQKESEIGNRELEKDPYDPLEQTTAANEKQLGVIQEELAFKKSKEDSLAGEEQASGIKGFCRRNKKMILVGLGLFALVIVVFISFIGLAMYKESLFDPDRVTIEIEGPENIESGSRVDYKLKIRNNNKADLLNAQVKINFSKELTIKEAAVLSNIQFDSAKIAIGLIEAKTEKTYDFSFDAFGPKDVQGFIDATLSYNPENFTSIFESRSQFSFLIKSSVLELTLLPTREVASGELSELRVIIENRGDNFISNLIISLEYPMGFSFSQAQPAPDSDNNKWKIDRIGPKEQREIIISGSLTGQVGAVKTLFATLGEIQGQGNILALNKSEGVMRITDARLQLINYFGESVPETVSAGSGLTINLKFKNTSSEPLRDLVLIENVSSPVLDKESLRVPGGFYDSEKNQIVWKASQIPALKILNPGEEGQVSFLIGIKDKFPMENEKDKNFVLSLQPEIESLDINSPLGQNKKVLGDKTEIKVASKLVLGMTGGYNDGELPNEGPFPPKVGEKTSITMRLNVLNTSNDLKDASLQFNLPAGISWEEDYLPKNEAVEFNDRANTIVWKIGTIPAGTGFILPIRNLAFRIGVTPSENQGGLGLSSILLVTGVKLTAVDEFTGKSIEYSLDEFKLNQLNDY